VSEFQRSALGACLVDGATFGYLVENLRAEHFTGRFRPVFLAMKALADRGHEVELVGLKNQLVVTGNLEAAGGIPAVASLVDGLPKVSKDILAGWVEQIKEASRRRRLAQEAARLVEATSDPMADSATLLSQFQAAAFGLEAGTISGRSFGPNDLRREASAAIDRLADGGGMIGIPSGLDGLDEMTMGFQPGQYIAIGARPSVGKSSLALQMASHAADLGHTVVFFSLEMEARELALIRACGEAQVSKYVIQASRGNAPVMDRLFAAVHRQATTPLHVEKLAMPSLGPIRARAARIKAEHGLGMVVVDYVQLMRSEGKSRANRNEELTEISAGLKAMAGDLGVPILVAAQLNRQAAGSDNERPRLSHFRDSGSLEADCDVAILLHRCDPKAERINPVAVDLIIEKNRTGMCGVVPTMFVGKHHRFEPRLEDVA
jgi:replicative DNA helicase